ncbi:hypothetical protein M2271_008285 [Streptomyces sp. LBL]|nr:hypothetical protein [Streptomyces sp. LBL]
MPGVATGRTLAAAALADDVGVDARRRTRAAGPTRRGAKPPVFPVAEIDDPALPEVLAELAAARADEMDVDTVNRELSIACKAIGWWRRQGWLESGPTIGTERRPAPPDRTKALSGNQIAAGNLGSNTAADHRDAAQLALAQLPPCHRRGRRTLIRTDSGGGTHEFVAWLAQRGRCLSYSVGMTITDAIHQAVLKIPASAWTPAVEPDGEVRDGAWVAELDAGSDYLEGRPKGMRLIVRKERPHRVPSCASPTPTGCA